MFLAKCKLFIISSLSLKPSPQISLSLFLIAVSPDSFFYFNLENSPLNYSHLTLSSVQAVANHLDINVYKERSNNQSYLIITMSAGDINPFLELVYQYSKNLPRLN